MKRNINEEIIPMIQEYKEAELLNNKERKDYIYSSILDLVAPLIRFCINRVSYKPPITFEELEEVSMVRLLTIINHFDESMDIKFSTFACNDLNFELIRYIRNNQSAIRIPESTQKDNVKIKNKIDAGEYVEKEKVEEYKRISEMLKFKNLEDYDAYSNDYEEMIERIENKEKIQKIMEKLDEKERDLLINIGMYGMTFAEYGRINGITREAVRQRYNKIIKKVRKEND